MLPFRRNQGVAGGERPATPYNTRSNTPEPLLINKHRRNIANIEEQVPLNIGEAAAIQNMGDEARFTVVGKLAIYLVLSVAVTLFNKSILITYPYPWILTCFHSVATALGTRLLAHVGDYLTPVEISQVQPDSFSMIAFAFLYTLNIAASNTSLGLTSVTIDQTVRAAIPVLTALIYATFYKRFRSAATYFTLLMLLMGAFTATYEALNISVLGFCFVLFGAQLAAWKAVIAYQMQVTGLNIRPLDIVRAVAPLSALYAFFFAYMNGEVDHFIVQEISGGHLTESGATFILLNSALAFVLNWASFSANVSAGPLAVAVLGNIKHIVTITIALAVFQHESGVIRWSGVLIMFFAAIHYIWLEHDRRDEILPFYNEQRDFNGK
ncbi:triose-phosphate transporter [Phlyctema vagabunda]|uniref:Triose-phosphate transporter n=1 Tax=Phlyctema vagabunda TaxID=108571 RepID=A0ABR4PQS6_9HELO